MANNVLSYLTKKKREKEKEELKEFVRGRGLIKNPKLNFNEGVSSKTTTNFKDLKPNQGISEKKKDVFTPSYKYTPIYKPTITTPKQPIQQIEEDPNSLNDKDLRNLEKARSLGIPEKKAMELVLEKKQMRENPTLETQKQTVIPNNLDKGLNFIGKSALDISGNIYKGTENAFTDTVNIGLGLIGSKERMKPPREIIAPTGEEYKGGLIQKSANEIAKRGKNIGEGSIAQSDLISSTKNPLKQLGYGLEGSYQMGGQIVGGLTNIAGEGLMSALSTLTPDEQKEQVKSIITDVAQKEDVKKVIDTLKVIKQDYNRFKQNNPRAGRNLDATAFYIDGILLEMVGDQAIDVVKNSLKKNIMPISNEIKQGLKTGVSLPKVDIKGKLDKFNKPRTEEDIALNILQPFKGMAKENGQKYYIETEDGQIEVDNTLLTKGQNALKKIVKEKDIGDNTTYKDLQSDIAKKTAEKGKQLETRLGQIKGTKKSESVGKALEKLSNVYDGVESTDLLVKQARINELKAKHEMEGLTAQEMNEVKILHTQSNNLFTEVGKTTKGFSKDDLRGVRKDIKEEIENFGKEQGIDDLANINNDYGELKALKTLIDDQQASIKSFKGRQLPETLGSRIGKFIAGFPVIKQLFTDPARGVVSYLGISLKADKINPLEVEKRLSEFLRELKKAGITEENIQKIKDGITKEINDTNFDPLKELETNNPIIPPTSGTPPPPPTGGGLNTTGILKKKTPPTNQTPPAGLTPKTDGNIVDKPIKVADDFIEKKGMSLKERKDQIKQQAKAERDQIKQQKQEQKKQEKEAKQKEKEEQRIIKKNQTDQEKEVKQKEKEKQGLIKKQEKEKQKLIKKEELEAKQEKRKLETLETIAKYDEVYEATLDNINVSGDKTQLKGIINDIMGKVKNKEIDLIRAKKLLNIIHNKKIQLSKTIKKPKAEKNTNKGLTKKDGGDDTTLGTPAKKPTTPKKEKTKTPTKTKEEIQKNNAEKKQVIDEIKKDNILNANDEKKLNEMSLEDLKVERDRIKAEKIKADEQKEIESAKLKEIKEKESEEQAKTTKTEPTTNEKAKKDIIQGKELEVLIEKAIKEQVEGGVEAKYTYGEQLKEVILDLDNAKTNKQILETTKDIDDWILWIGWERIHKYPSLEKAMDLVYKKIIDKRNNIVGNIDLKLFDDFIGKIKERNNKLTENMENQISLPKPTIKKPSDVIQGNIDDILRAVDEELLTLDEDTKLKLVEAIVELDKEMSNVGKTDNIDITDKLTNEKLKKANEYNDALKSGDKEEIKRTKKEYQKARDDLAKYKNKNETKSEEEIQKTNERQTRNNEFKNKLNDFYKGIIDEDFIITTSKSDKYKNGENDGFWLVLKNNLDYNGKPKKTFIGSYFDLNKNFDEAKKYIKDIPFNEGAKIKKPTTETHKPPITKPTPTINKEALKKVKEDFKNKKGLKPKEEVKPTIKNPIINKTALAKVKEKFKIEKEKKNLLLNPKKDESAGNLQNKTKGQPTIKDNENEKGPGDNIVNNGGRGGSKGNGGKGKGLVSVRKENNDKAIKVLENKKYSSNKNDYTDEEIEILRNYTGTGGLNVKSDTGVGALSEFYTPKKIVDKMYEILNKLGIHGKGYEPSLGIGAFLKNKPNNLKLDGGELSNISGTIAKILYPDSDIRIGDFQDLFMRPNNDFAYSKKSYDFETYDFLIGNPPYFKRGGGKSLVDKHLSQSEDYFVSKGLDMLNQGGVLTYIVKSGFLGKVGPQNLKAKMDIASKGQLIGAYRLPSGLFDNTGIGTEIIIIRKGKGNLDDFINDNYFKKNKDNLLYDKVVGEGQFTKYIGDETQLDKIGQGLEKLDEVKTTATEIEKSIEITKPATQNKIIKNPNIEVKEGKQENKLLTDDENTSDYFSKTGYDLEVEGLYNIPKGKGQDLNYIDGKIYTNEFYGSGYVYDKMKALENNKDYIIENYGIEQYNKQKKLLEDVTPTPKKIKEISISYKNDALLQISNKEGMSLERLFDRYLRNKRPGVLYGLSLGDIQGEFYGRKSNADKHIRVYLPIETNRIFNEFIQESLDDIEIVKKLEDDFNIKKNGYVEPNYSKIPLIIKGISKTFKGAPFNFSKTQIGGIKKLVNKGVGLVAYGVGVGKTHTIIGAVKSSMDLGKTKRPLIIVPGATLNTWIKTIQEVIPGIKVNNLGGLTVPDLKRLGDDYTNYIKDGEISVITHEGIKKIGADINELTNITSGLRDTMLSKRKTGAKDVEKGDLDIDKFLSEVYGEALDYITLNSLGIDHISIDEIHNFRKVFGKAEVEKGENRYSNFTNKTSKRAQKLFIMSQQILNQNDGKGVFLASATPFENKPTEIYNIFSLIAYKELQRKGLNNINDFYNYFAKFKTEFQKNTKGEFVDKEVFYDFTNKDELQSLIREFIDFKEDKTLVRPTRDVETPKLDMSDLQKSNLQKILNMAKKDKDGILKANTFAKANSISPYFVNEFMGDMPRPTSKELVENSPKLKFAYEMIKSLKTKYPDKGHFIYIGDTGVDFFESYKNYFVENGIYKPEEIGIIKGDVKPEMRTKIQDGFNSGKIKVLIGGTPTKEGINLQTNGIATYNLNLGWNPTEIEQVSGRVPRQGSNASNVGEYYPLLYNSNDVRMFQLFKEKGGRISSLFDYTKKIEDQGVGIDYKEAMIDLMTDPQDKVTIKLSLLKKELDNERVGYENTLSKIQDVYRQSNNLKNDLEKLRPEYESLKNNVDLIKKGGGVIDWYSQQMIDKVKNLKKEIGNKEFSYEVKKGILKDYNIKNEEDFNILVKDYEGKVLTAKTKLEELDNQKTDLLKKYIEEKEIEDKSKKSLEEQVSLLTDKLNIKFLSDEELYNIKQELIKKEAEEEIKINKKGLTPKK